MCAGMGEMPYPQVDLNLILIMIIIKFLAETTSSVISSALVGAISLLKPWGCSGAASISFWVGRK